MITLQSLAQSIALSAPSGDRIDMYVLSQAAMKIASLRIQKPTCESFATSATPVVSPCQSLTTTTTASPQDINAPPFNLIVSASIATSLRGLAI